MTHHLHGPSGDLIFYSLISTAGCLTLVFKEVLNLEPHFNVLWKRISIYSLPPRLYSDITNFLTSITVWSFSSNTFDLRRITMASLTRRYKAGPASPCPAPQIPISDPLNPTSSDGRPALDIELLKNVQAGLGSHVARKPSFMDLPTEIHLLITEQLIYPDALSMKHVNRYFYNLVDTGVRKKVEWLCECRRLHLGCPNDKRCDLGSDVRFCRGSVKWVCFSCLSYSISNLVFNFPFFKNGQILITISRLLMQRWREHNECEARPGLGCVVYSTSTCVHRRKLRTRVKRWMRLKLTIDVHFLILALLVAFGAWWAVQLFY